MRAQTSRFRLLFAVVAAIGVIDCGTDDKRPLRMPGGGTPGPFSFDWLRGQGGGGADGGAGGLLEGPCRADESPHACTVYHEAGCTTGVQRCVDGTWASCQVERPEGD